MRTDGPGALNMDVTTAGVRVAVGAIERQVQPFGAFSGGNDCNLRHGMNRQVGWITVAAVFP